MLQKLGENRVGFDLLFVDLTRHDDSVVAAVRTGRQDKLPRLAQFHHAVPYIFDDRSSGSESKKIEAHRSKRDFLHFATHLLVLGEEVLWEGERSYRAEHEKKSKHVKVQERIFEAERGRNIYTWFTEVVCRLLKLPPHRV